MVRIRISLFEVVITVAVIVAVATGHLKAGCSAAGGEIACGVVLMQKP